MSFSANAIASINEASLDGGLTFDPTIETEEGKITIAQIQTEEDSDPKVINFLVKFSDKTKKPVGFFREKDEKNQDVFFNENITIFKEADGEYIFSVSIDKSEKSPTKLYLGYDNTRGGYYYVKEIILFFSHNKWHPVFTMDPYIYIYDEKDE